MTVDLNAMALFVRVVEYKSFTEASKRLGIPISTVSRKVTELEKSLGIRLLERSTRQLRLTELGQEYYHYCQRGLVEFEMGALMINNRQCEVSGTLRLSLPPNIADVLIAPIVCAFQQVYPKTTIKILVTERYVDLIEDRVDIALRVGKLKDSSLVARRLFLYRHLLVAAPEYLKRHGEPQHPIELAAHRLISFVGWQGSVVWLLNNGQQSHEIAIDCALTINDMAGIQYVVEAAQGISEIPAFICGEAIQQGRLVEIMPSWKFSATMLSLIYPSKRNTSRLVKLFMDFCVEYIEKHMPFSGM